MSEKRFTINLEDECIDDAEERIFISFLDRIDFYELCGFLNEQDEKIKELEEENEELKEIHQKGSKSCEKWKQHKEAQIQQLEKMNEDLREVNKENRLLHEENVKQCERWKNLYELKDAEVTARVDTLNRVCNYYLTEVQFIADTDPNDAVKEVINEILNTEVENDE